MTTLPEVISQNRDAIAAFAQAATRVPPERWDQPPAPGKWSAGQITEHLALSYELGAAGLRGEFPGAAAPRLLRPLIRHFFLTPVLAKGRFAKAAKAPGPFQPSVSPAPATTLLPRLEQASLRLETALTTEMSAGRPTTDHPFFGRVGLADYLRLQVIHTSHHRGQLPVTAPQ